MTNVPEIRFKGFTDAWEQCRLGDVAEITSGGTPSREISDYWNGEIPWSTTAEVNYSLIEHTAENITKAGLDNSSAKIMPIGTILMAMYGQGKTRGQVAVLGIEAATNQANANIVVNDGVNNCFIYHQLVKNYLTTRASANEGGQANLSLGIVKDLHISFTKDSTEQTIIGTFFHTLDNTIAIYKRKFDGLKQLKSAYLQQMFPQAGEVVPKVRFDGFTEPWELRGADEIFCTVSDKGHIHLPVLSASQEHGMVLRNEIGIDIKFDSTNTTTYKRVLPGQFVIHLRSFQGGLAYSKIEGITSPAYTILDFIDKGKQVPEFWIDVLRSEKFIKMLESVTYGIRDGRSISFNDFSILKLHYPSHDEQAAIGQFFSSLDCNINEMQSKINSLAKLKSSFLQKMFV